MSNTDAVAAGLRPLNTRVLPDPDGNIRHVLDDADLLIRHAAETGKSINPEVVNTIQTSRESFEKGEWGPEAAKIFWPAYSELCATVQPVTAESLRACNGSLLETTLRRYRKVGIWLTIIILPLSVLMFVNTSISNEISDRIKENDQLALTLRDAATALSEQAGQANTGATTPGSSARNSLIVREPDVVTTLQKFATANRMLYGRAGLLDNFILRGERGPFASMSEQEKHSELELNPKIADVVGESFGKVNTYQKIRAFAKQVQQMNLVIYGAITAYILPVLYSLLGACAYELRSLAKEVIDRTYVPTSASLARIIIALIAGLVVGLFNNFTQGITLSPLAVAFLVGYAVEVFFSFLDAFLETLRKVRT